MENDSSVLTEKIQQDLQQITNYLNKIANYRYHLLIYKLAKNGQVKLTNLADMSGYNISRIYQIVDAFDSKATDTKEEPTQ